MNKLLPVFFSVLCASIAHADYEIDADYVGSATVTINGDCKKTVKIANASYGEVVDTDTGDEFWAIISSSDQLLHTESDWTQLSGSSTNKSRLSKYSVKLDAATLAQLVTDMCGDLNFGEEDRDYSANNSIYFDNLKANDQYSSKAKGDTYKFNASANFYTIKSNSEIKYKTAKNTIKISFNGAKL